MMKLCMEKNHCQIKCPVMTGSGSQIYGLLLAYQFVHPGKKLLFMGGEIAQWSEWSHDNSLEWYLFKWERHTGIQLLVSDLNRIYQNYSGTA